MIDALLPIALIVGGLALGWWLKGRTAKTRKRALQVGSLILAAPIPVWLFASMADNETLGLLAGFGMMALLAAAVPFCVGIFVGWKLRKR